jgi:hypothetical protein
VVLDLGILEMVEDTKKEPMEKKFVKTRRKDEDDR